MRKSNAAEHVTAGLRKAILRGELRPGDYVRQEKWAARLDRMSRYFEHVGTDLARSAERWRSIFDRP